MDRNVDPSAASFIAALDVPRKGNVDRNQDMQRANYIGRDVPRKGNVDRNLQTMDYETVQLWTFPARGTWIEM